ncbi:PEP-CTERM sorting domain-containing protein [Alienimonas chondri]|uniref:PEP-CTERM sorting domain-containing protein n=1 Tax=Alienimonas chondri TaxID=2681879 RepID=A0ABX1VDQ7_9PLAN|nr:PEP-CTERM sorting domain-containing protein [Alienimonas chondri]NNJ25551.1 hypothetical protein [Alienimonas chondri]
MPPRRLVAPLAVWLCLTTASAAWAGLVTHVDFGQYDGHDFKLRLGQATSDAGVPTFSDSERAEIQANVLDGLRRAYAEFDVTFQTTDAGATETIRLDDFFPDSGTVYGRVERLDYRNQSNGDVARVYTENFGGFIERHKARDQQIAELSAALTGTAAHELGHNLGLSHQDSYGDPGFTYTGLEGAIDSGGAQDGRIMATGLTGLSEAQRETDRTFSQFSKLKLEFAEGLTVTGPTPSIAETLLSHDTTATAQAVTLVAQTISGFEAANIIGSIGTALESDLFALDLTSSGYLTVATITTGVETAVDTVLSVFDSDGLRLGEVNDTTLDGDLFGGPSAVQTTDSLLYGLRIEGPGRYFARVEGFGGATGDYELLVGFDSDVSAVPEPGAGLLALLAGAVGVAVRRRRRRLSA